MSGSCQTLGFDGSMKGMGSTGQLHTLERYFLSWSGSQLLFECLLTRVLPVPSPKRCYSKGQQVTNFLLRDITDIFCTPASKGNASACLPKQGQGLGWGGEIQLRKSQGTFSASFLHISECTEQPSGAVTLPRSCQHNRLMPLRQTDSAETD